MAQVVSTTENIFTQCVAKLQMIDNFATLICKNKASENLLLYKAITANEAFPRNLLYAARKPVVQQLLVEMRNFCTISGRMQNRLEQLTASFFVSDATHRICAKMRCEFVSTSPDSAISLHVPHVTLATCNLVKGLPIISTCNRAIYMPFCTQFSQFEENMRTLLANCDRFDRL